MSTFPSANRSFSRATRPCVVILTRKEARYVRDMLAADLHSYVGSRLSMLRGKAVKIIDEFEKNRPELSDRPEFDELCLSASAAQKLIKAMGGAL